MKKKSFKIIALFIITIFCACGGEKANHENNSIDNKPDKTYPSLFLLSKGLTTDTLKLSFLDQLKKEPRLNSVAVVVNASSTDKKKRKKRTK